MNGKEAAEMVRKEYSYLRNIVKGFSPEHGEYRPCPGMMTTAQQINHIAQTVYWFREGAFGKGFDLDFEKLEAVNQVQISLADALAELERQYAGFVDFLEGQSEADLSAPMADNPLFGPAPRYTFLFAQTDHTAHHRGSLAVYLRLLGIVPTMAYQG